MSIWESIVVALDNLRLNKLRSFLTMIGIVFGVAAVVTVVSIGQAGQSSIISTVSNLEDGYFIIFRNTDMSGSEDAYFRLRELNEIRKLEGVRYASTSMPFKMTYKFKQDNLRFTITGTTNESSKMQKIDLLEGRFFTSQEERGRQKVIIIDNKFAEKVYGTTEGVVGRKLVLSGGTFRIIGIYKPEENILSGFEGENYSGYAPITAVAKESPDNLKFSMFEVVAKSPENVNDTVDEVKKWAAKKKNVEPSAFLSQTGEDTEMMVSSIFGIMQTIIGSIAGISLLVGGIGVMNIMLVSVTERTREIGIRKAIGATPGTIMLQFMIEAVVLCFIGGTLGALLGLGAAYLFSIIAKWPFVISVGAIVLAFGFSAAVGIFFGLYPANKASKLHPIEALRYE